MPFTMMFRFTERLTLLGLAHLWLQHSLSGAGAVQTDSLIHAVISGEIIAHLVTVATALVLCPTVCAALCLR